MRDLTLRQQEILQPIRERVGAISLLSARIGIIQEAGCRSANADETRGFSPVVAGLRHPEFVIEGIGSDVLHLGIKL